MPLITHNGLRFYLQKRTQTAIVYRIARDYYQRASFVIPESIDFESHIYHVIGIADRAFEDGEQLRTISIPQGIKMIGDHAFCGCPLTSITIPHTVRSIGYGAFLDCSDLTSITLSHGITNIQPCAFAGCLNLGSIILPDSVKVVENYAFADCVALSDIYCYAQEPPAVTEVTFHDIMQPTSAYHAHLHILESALVAYQSHPIWKKFQYISTKSL